MTASIAFDFSRKNNGRSEPDPCLYLSLVRKCSGKVNEGQSPTLGRVCS